MENKVDVLIVGSGASGAAAAWSLSRDPSVRILCLEQGDVYEKKNFPSNFADWEILKSGAYSSDPNIRKNSGDYPIDNSNSPISLANFNGFGGSTILYSGHFPRFHPSDFCTASLDSVGDDWPFSYEDLEPYFSENEKMMGVAGLVGDPAYPDYKSLLPPVAMGEAVERLALGFNKMGWHWWPSYSAINTRSHMGRAACINLGPCNTGCAQGAKGSVDVTYWPLALKQGVKLKTGCAVHKIVTDERNNARGVIYFDKNGCEYYQEASVVILACGGAGTPRLLLNSKNKNYPNGLLNNYDVVGRNLMLHPLGYTEAIFDEDVASTIGPQGCSIYSHEFYETDLDRGFSRGFTMQVLRGSSPIETATNSYMMRQLELAKEHHKMFEKIYNKNIGIAIITEDLPELHNRITLNDSAKDDFGIPGISCHYTISENTKNILKFGLQKSKEVLEASGATVTSSFAPVRNTGWHIMGTARMGGTVEKSVVNEFGQSHEIKNLFIVDSSVFVTSAAVNPVATLQAVTLRICDYIRARVSIGFD